MGDVPPADGRDRDRLRTKSRGRDDCPDPSTTFTTRRQFIGRAAAAIGFAFVARVRAGAAQPGGASRLAYVGSFTSKARNARGEGLSVFRVDSVTGAWSRIQLLADEINPSYLAIDARGRCLYAVHADSDVVSAFGIDPREGTLTLANRQSTGGANPVHLAIDPTGRFLTIANYGGGSVAVVAVRGDGSLGARTDLVTLAGEHGPHPIEQAASHPHHCPFDPSGRLLVVPDKGLDRVFVFRLDVGTGKLQAMDPPSVATRAGAGPRHLDFHPTAPYAYLVNELDSTVAVFRLDASRGVLAPVQLVPSLPSSFTGPNTGSGIEVSRSGRFVYASNRGHDSLAVFAVDPRDGTLTPRGWTPTGGRVPRFFCFDPSGRMIYAANQASDTIVAFRVDPFSGALKRTGRALQTGTPTAIAFHRVL